PVSPETYLCFSGLPLGPRSLRPARVRRTVGHSATVKLTRPNVRLPDHTARRPAVSCRSGIGVSLQAAAQRFFQAGWCRCRIRLLFPGSPEPPERTRVRIPDLRGVEISSQQADEPPGQVELFRRG